MPTELPVLGPAHGPPGPRRRATPSPRPRSSPTRSGPASCGCFATGPVCVCEMAAALGERENNVSNHLARLRDAGLVRAEPPRGERAGSCTTSATRPRSRAALAALADVLRMTTLAVAARARSRSG